MDNRQAFMTRQRTELAQYLADERRMIATFMLQVYNVDLKFTGTMYEDSQDRLWMSAMGYPWSGSKRFYYMDAVNSIYIEESPANPETPSLKGER